MTKVIAIHEVIRTVDGKRVVVPPRSAFDASGAELKSLLDAGAVRKPKDAAALPPTSDDDDPRDNDAVGVTVIQDDDEGFVVEKEGVRFSPPRNTVRKDGTLTKAGEKAFEAAKAAAEDEGDLL